ncbi:hypothetical protein GCM10027277_33240 [Pseudoduganella ginsengisoli]|uniref:DUF2314 domain-containing protein n=1 Tax=Pseudoduganella ginsengisoli TaxID=1462440 RepID=A0A6L6Q781_9BURK|nr:hypothetical protein [Pseudoduganella ginsengisoli]MTW05309.1 hypothetical protein [Pseudoduganella ginsengisoli]
MTIFLFTIAAVAGLTAAYWWFIGRNRPIVPPLNIADDDPLMLEAVEKARESITELRGHFVESAEHVQVKVPFVTSSGTTEFLWGELLAITAEDMEVKYLTPPVTHTGYLERIHRHPIGELRDWVYMKNPGNYQGGFSMRVMFIRGRELWGELPPNIKAEEANYGNISAQNSR